MISEAGDTPNGAAADPSRDYEVGYGRPPKASQFRKGQSGNPKGRPKGKRGLKSDLRAELSQKVEITENGQKIALSAQRIIVKQLTTRAMKGDLRAIEKLSQLILGVFGPDDENPPEARKLAADDLAIIAAFEARRGRHGDGGAKEQDDAAPDA